MLQTRDTADEPCGLHVASSPGSRYDRLTQWWQRKKQRVTARCCNAEAASLCLHCLEGMTVFVKWCAGGCRIRMMNSRNIHSRFRGFLTTWGLAIQLFVFVFVCLATTWTRTHLVVKLIKAKHWLQSILLLCIFCLTASQHLPLSIKSSNLIFYPFPTFMIVRDDLTGW